MPDYLDLLTRRTEADTSHIEELRFLVDIEGHHEAQKERLAARHRLTAAEVAQSRIADNPPPRKMSQKPAAQEAAEAVAAAEADYEAAKVREQECFLVAHLATPTRAQISKAQGGGDVYEALLRSQLVKVTDVHGTHLPEVTADHIINLWAVAPAFVRIGFERWFDESVRPVDYPM